MEFSHEPVLLNECIENLRINQDGIYVDATLGGAGHSLEIAKRLSRDGILIGIDRDEESIAAAREKLKEFDNVIYVKNNHDNISEVKPLEISQSLLLRVRQRGSSRNKTNEWKSPGYKKNIRRFADR